VYLARDPATALEVALKNFDLVPGEVSRESRRLRSTFMNEASLVGKLRHPHVVQMLDAVDEPGLRFVVMEYVPGGALSQYVTADNLLPLDRVVDVVLKVSGALDCAYRHGIIHRDVKPTNILITEDFEVKLSDFGVALLPDAAHTIIDQAGSPAYMSPEQISGKTLTHRSDIYSLGVVLYQLLTGRKPFDARAYSILMYQILNREPSPLQIFRRELPETFNAVVQRALRKDPNERYGSWAEFARDMAGLLAQIKVPGDTDTRGFEQVRNLGLFRDFREIEIWEALRICSWRHFDAGETILVEGEKGDTCFYLVIEGEVGVSRGGVSLNTLAAGDCFGNLLYFVSPVRNRFTTVRALSRTLVIEISAESLSAASDACQVQFTRAFMRLLVDRLEAANDALATR
jgi:serine/threonine protein kinase